MTLSDLLGRPERWARLLGWALGLGLLLGIIGPFGSYPANSFNRITYWVCLMAGGTVILWPCVAMAAVAGPPRGFPLAFSVGVAVLVGALAVALFAEQEARLFWPVRVSGMRAIEWYGQTLVMALPLAAGALWLELRWHGAAQPGLAATSTPPPVMPANGPLPPHLIEQALCLQMEDHHVRIHGAGRSWLHLGTMRDAIEQVGADRGLQVHRSWWVARDAVRGAEEEGRAVSLILTNGLKVPVARNRVAAIRAEGWLEATARAEA